MYGAPDIVAVRDWFLPPFTFVKDGGTRAFEESEQGACHCEPQMRLVWMPASKNPVGWLESEMKKVYLLLLVLHICAAVGLRAQSAPAAASRTLVRAGHVLDVKTGAEPAAMTVIVTGDKITAVAPTSSTPKQAGDVEIDLTKYTVMPGLIDVHTHLTMANNFDPYFELTMTPGKEAIIGVENAKVTLEAGFTTVRNVGAGGYVMLRCAMRSMRGIFRGHICRCRGLRWGLREDTATRICCRSSIT